MRSVFHKFLIWICLIAWATHGIPWIQAQTQVQTQTQVQARTWSKEELQMILQTLDGQEVNELTAKLDQWMSAEKDSCAKVLFAKTAFEHYSASPVMGYERVALYIADTYLLSPEFKLSDEEEFQVLWYTQITRPNQIGAYAPDLMLQDPLGYPIPLQQLPGDYLVLWFVDDQCPICQKEYERLADWLLTWTQAPTCELSMVRCYVGDDYERWKSYRESHSLPQQDSLVVWEAWDPEFNTGFQIKYGVISTPKLFLINSENILVGRNLQTESLKELLGSLTDPNFRKTQLHQYFTQLFGTILASSGADPQADRWLVQYAIDGMFQQQQDEEESLRTTFFELYQFLKSHPSYLLQEGAVYLGEQYILNRPELWIGKTVGNETFSEEKMEELAFALEMFHRNPLGAVTTDLKLQTLNGSAYRITDSPAAYTVLYFYKTDCAACDAFTADLERILPRFSGQNLQTLAIYTGRKGRSWKRYASGSSLECEHLADLNGTSGMFQTYNLSAVPSLYLLDADKRVIAKDIPPHTLEEILNAIYPQ